MAQSDATSQPIGDDFGGAAEAARVAVLIPLALDEPYDYRVPAELAAAPGSFVRVPLGPREAHLAAKKRPRL